MSLIRFKRGLKSNLPTVASDGEPLVALDSRELFIGTGSSVVPLLNTDDISIEKYTDVDGIVKIRSKEIDGGEW